MFSPFLYNNGMNWYENFRESLCVNWFKSIFRHLRKDFYEGITVLPADDPKELLLGWTIHEEIGAIIMNPDATVKMTFDVEEETYKYPSLGIIRNE